MKVYALTGVPPEVQAYAMAKYSRSAQSMQESIRELSAQRAEQFLETFYFQYGHRSIADLAHVALAAEEISMLAAIRLVDEPLWDGQERSTRYQNFRASGYHIPAELVGTAHHADYVAAADQLFADYHQLSRALTTVLAEAYPCPSGRDAAAHTRTLRARAFDVARYLLPLATRTSVGQITSARVLERQIARLRAEPVAEVQALGESLRAACQTPGFDLTRERTLAALNGHGLLLPDAVPAVAPAPTLVKYAEPSAYPQSAYTDLAPVAASLLAGVEPDRSFTVQLAEPTSLEDDAVTTLLYRVDAGGRSFRQVQQAVASLAAGVKRDILDAALHGRGAHDDWPRELQGGGGLTVDFLIDIGAYRDLHRHRRCVQVVQAFTADHGSDDPTDLLHHGLAAAAPRTIADGLHHALGDALTRGGNAARLLESALPAVSAYLLPMGYRVRAAFKMDLAQAAYIAELRTRPGGHFSYRRAAYAMYTALCDVHPAIARHIRVTDPADDRLLER